MKRWQSRLSVFLFALKALAVADAETLDDFESLASWRVIASDGVHATIHAGDGLAGRALRIEYDFKAGAGFCVVRRDLALPLPRNFRFSFALRGEGPPNNLEFKLVDASGQNVWWVNQPAFQWPSAWQTQVWRARQFRFAWGPSGGAPLESVGAIEFAVASSSGGRGCVLIDELTFEPLPELPPTTQPALVTFSSQAAGAAAPPAQLGDAKLNWVAAATDTAPWLQLDFQQTRALGGLMIDWGDAGYATAYAVQLSDDGMKWEPAARVDGSAITRSYVALPNTETRFLRVRIEAVHGGHPAQVRHMRVLDIQFGDSANEMFATIARDSARGRYPRYFLGQQPSWTVMGVDGAATEALLDGDGAVEVSKLSYRVEPFLWLGGRLVTWADAQITQSLADDYLPIPSVTWTVGDLELQITAIADGPPPDPMLAAGYTLKNRGPQARAGSLLLAVRPFQVLPPWQALNVVGGVTRVSQLDLDLQGGRVNDRTGLVLWQPASACGATTFVQGDITAYFDTGRLPDAMAVNDPRGFASAAWRFDFNLPAGAQETFAWSAPRRESAPQDAPDYEFSQLVERVRAAWIDRLSTLPLRLPSSAAKLANAFRSNLAYVLINADGPAIQPGSRTYERSWIRDGALTGTALLYTGHTGRVRDYLAWFAPNQYPNGKIPCVVDHRGPDPVPEHDSTGEFIYLVLKYYQFSRDRAFLEQLLPHVVRGVDYIEALRAERLTDAYRDGPPELRACFGLVPESISHEGYSAKPMHSYWDNFWVLRGLKDATTIAEVLGRADLHERFRRLRDEFRTSLYDSLALTMRAKQIAYLPGCAELGDFDATSTAIAIFPGGEVSHLPPAALQATFDRYYEFFRNRRDGRLEWENYTPYEVRIIGTFVRLGQPDRAHELLEFFFRDQSPPAWNQWAEVVWRDPNAPRFIGDLPHTWVGSDFLSAVRSMFVYEREHDETLVLAAGIRPEWVTDQGGVQIENWPTEYGSVSYHLTATGNRFSASVGTSGVFPPNGLVLRSPLPGRILQVTVDGATTRTFSEREVHLRTGGNNIVVTHEP